MDYHSRYSAIELDKNNSNKEASSSELMVAIQEGDIEKASKLILNGVNVNETNDLGKTALHYAVQKQIEQIVGLLLKQDGINIDAMQCDGLTPLMYACQIKNTNQNIIKMLLQQECSLHEVDIVNEKTAIHYAAEVCSLQVIQLLIENGADINTQDAKKDTVLHIAMRRRNEELVTMLLYYKADTSIANNWGPPIQEAQTDGIKELLLPYTDLCNEDVLYCLDFATMKFILNTYQSKAVFVEWLLEDIPTRMRYLFIIHKVPLAQMWQFLHELFDDEDMHEIMYLPETSACLLEIRPFRTSSRSQEGYTADMLRLLLSNCNVLKNRTLKTLQQSIEFSPIIIRVLVDIDVIIEEDTQRNAYIQMVEPPPWPLLWKMYCTPRVDLQEDLLQSADNKTAMRFYAIGRTPSLVELCRDKIRDTALNKYSRMEPNKPFHYATALKHLEIPRVMIDVLLLRKPLY